MKLILLGFFTLSLIITSCVQKSSKKEVSDHETAKNNDYTRLDWIDSSNFLTDSLEHFRGLSIYSGIAYISGSLGSIISVDLKTGQFTHLLKISTYHLRDIDVINDSILVALAITNPASIIRVNYLTKTISSEFKGSDSLDFWDGINFKDEQNGYAFGDPKEDKPVIFSTQSGGKEWQRAVQNFPKTAENYAGFAASGSSILYLQNNTVIIGLGNETGKILRSTDNGVTWELITFPYHYEIGGTGLYSLACADNNKIVGVGGHWQNTDCDSSKIYSEDGGLTWFVSEGIQEYRSCVCYFKQGIFLATGTTGTDISYDYGKSWQLIDSMGFNSIQITQQGFGIAVGNYGQIKLFNLH